MTHSQVACHALATHSFTLRVPSSYYYDVYVSHVPHAVSLELYGVRIMNTLQVES